MMARIGPRCHSIRSRRVSKFSSQRALRLGVADHPLDGRETPAQAALQLVHLLVHVVDRELWIDMAMKVDDCALRSLAHAHIVNFPDRSELRRDFAQQGADRAGAVGRGIGAGDILRLQRLDMGLDLDVGAEFLLDRRFKPARDLMRGPERPSTSRSSETDRRLAIACTVT